MLIKRCDHQTCAQAIIGVNSEICDRHAGLPSFNGRHVAFSNTNNIFTNVYNLSSRDMSGAGFTLLTDVGKIGELCSIVKCSICQVTIQMSQWNLKLTPFENHKYANPNCQTIKLLESIEHQPLYTYYQNDSLRFTSFSNMGIHNVAAQNLADNNFYLSDSKTIKANCCQGTISIQDINWANVSSQHHIIFPFCEWAKSYFDQDPLGKQELEFNRRINMVALLFRKNIQESQLTGKLLLEKLIIDELDIIRDRCNVLAPRPFIFEGLMGTCEQLSKLYSSDSSGPAYGAASTSFIDANRDPFIIFINTCCRYKQFHEEQQRQSKGGHKIEYSTALTHNDTWSLIMHSMTPNNVALLDQYELFLGGTLRVFDDPTNKYSEGTKKILMAPGDNWDQAFSQAKIISGMEFCPIVYWYMNFISTNKQTFSTVSSTATLQPTSNSINGPSNLQGGGLPQFSQLSLFGPQGAHSTSSSIVGSSLTSNPQSPLLQPNITTRFSNVNDFSTTIPSSHSPMNLFPAACAPTPSNSRPLPGPFDKARFGVLPTG